MRAIEKGAKPVGDHNPHEGITGKLFMAATNRGTQVQVWVADDAVTNRDHRHFCHGVAFHTFKEFGYTVMSGDANKVLNDEYTKLVPPGKKDQRFTNSLPAEEAADLGDCLGAAPRATVAAWEDAEGNVVHTALIWSFPDSGARTAGNTTMVTKNGFNAGRQMHLAEVCVAYKSTAYFSFWTKGRAQDTVCVIL
jgi:hypothetical protein